MSDVRFNIGDKIVDRYEVRQILGGGMGVVYLCHDHQDGIPFALKTFLDKYLANSAAKQRFIKEATTWINLGHHLNIVEAERVEKIGDKPFIVLECVLDSNGLSSSLANKLSNETIDENMALNISLQLCLGMDFVNKKMPGLIHRDIKPSNILISHTGIPKITDFGLVEVLNVHRKPSSTSTEFNRDNILNSQDLTQNGEVVGTPSYMSPEQYKGAALDTRSDIYSLGCVLYEMLVGDNYTRRKLSIQDESDLFKNLHTKLISILKKCLHPEPQNRYSSFFDFGIALESYYKETLNLEPELKCSIEMAPGVWVQTVESSFRQAAETKAVLESSVDSGKIPPNITLLQRKGDSLMNMGHYQEALECFEKCINESLKYQAEDVQAYAEKTKVGLDKANAEFKQMLVGLYLNKANALQGLGRGTESVSLYEKALSINPDDGNLWYNLAEALYNLLNDSHGAIAAYRKAIKINSSDDMAWASLGFVLSQVGKSEESIKCYDQALIINPSSVCALANKGVAMLEQENKTIALECFQEVLRIEPGNSLAWYYNGKIIAGHNPSEALESFKRAVQLEPNNPHFQMAMNELKSQ